MTEHRSVLFAEGRPKLRESFAEYSRRGGYEALRKVRSQGRPSTVIEEVEKAVLRGRGGAGFPAAKKMALCAREEGGEKYVVANGGEDEPGSFKDRSLLEYTPHAVLEGVLLAAYAVGAQRAYFYVNETYGEALRRVESAIQEATTAGLLDGVTVETKASPTQYVAGEDTAVLEVLEGKPPLPRRKPPYPVTSGLFGKPTLVNNVETLANLPPILLHGADWFRSIGTAESFGTMLYSMNDEWACPGVYELPYGAHEGELLYGLAGGLKEDIPLRALLPGGPSSAFVLPDPDRILSPESLRAVGSNIGCGVMRGYADGTCMVEVVLQIAQFFQRESCGQCPACRMETNLLATTLDKVRRGQIPATALDQIPRVLDFNRGKGFCSFINMPGPPLLSAIKLFPEDFQAHLTTGGCLVRTPVF